MFTNYATNNLAPEVNKLSYYVKLCLLTLAFNYNNVAIYFSSITQYRTFKHCVLVGITQGTNILSRKWKVKTSRYILVTDTTLCEV
jgi:hypothetical protein